MNDNTQITLRGRIGTEPELRISQKGTQWTRFRIAVPVSFKDKQGIYVELDPRWYTVRAWGRLAASAAGSLKKGDAVVVLGHPTAEAWIGKQGEVNSTLTVTAHAIGPDLTFTSVRVLRPDKTGEKAAGNGSEQQAGHSLGSSWDSAGLNQSYSGVPRTSFLEQNDHSRELSGTENNQVDADCFHQSAQSDHEEERLDEHADVSGEEVLEGNKREPALVGASLGSGSEPF